MKTDIEIQENVLAELRNTPLIDANEIGIAVKNGIVTISGMVDSYPQKVRIEKTIKKVKGVRGIAEDIEVVLNEIHKKNDSELAQIILKSIEWHSAMQIENIQITVEDAWVTIEGLAQWEFQRKSVTKAVETIWGIKGITNNIRLADRPAASDIKKKIQDSLLRNACIEANKIEVMTDGGKVTLKGKIKSWVEFEEVENAVWKTPGVSKVDNKLEFDYEV